MSGFALVFLPALTSAAPSAMLTVDSSHTLHVGGPPNAWRGPTSVTPGPRCIHSVSLVALPAHVQLGQVVAFDSNVRMASQPLAACTFTLSFSYSGLPPGCVSADTATLSCPATVLGTYHVTVLVHGPWVPLTATTNITIMG